MIVLFGVIICLLALIVIGLSGDVRRSWRPWMLQIGLVAMFGGGLIASFATQAVESLGWARP